MGTTHVTFAVPPDHGEVTGALLRPDDAAALFVFAHGAGAGMDHPFMVDVARRLSELGIATFRFNFPYMMRERGWPPDRAPVLMAAARAAVDEARSSAPDLPVVAGGKSLGGRMMSAAHATDPLPGVRGIAFFGFPLHTAKRPSTDRAERLAGVGLPMLFLQGTRDELADLELLRPALGGVEPSPSLHVVEGADHGFHVLKRSGRTDDEVRHELCETFAGWVDGVI